MEARQVSNLQEVIQQGLDKRIFPGAVVYVRGTQGVFREAVGYAQTTPGSRPMQWETVFDIASLTKVTATLPAVLLSIQLGKLALHEPIASYLPNWLKFTSANSRKDVTVYHLLTHTSGLPAWRPFYIRHTSAAQYLEAICREPLESEPGVRVVYSDLGFMLLGFLLECVWSKSLDVLCQELVFSPLGLHHTVYRPIDAPRDRFAATEQGNQCEQGMALSYADQSSLGRVPTGALRLTREEVVGFAWRTDVTCGAVNDGNAFYGLHGVSGHAGLFSTADDLMRYARTWLDNRDANGQPFLRKDLREMAVNNQTRALNVARGLGFEAVPDTTSGVLQTPCSAGKMAPPGAFGHTGFTGTSLWIDPASDTCVVVLTNRVHPQVQEGIADWRKAIHRAVFGV